MPRTSTLRKTLITISTLLMLCPAPGPDGRAWSQDSRQACLDREANAFFAKLAAAVVDGTVDPAKIGDDFIGKGTESIIAACSPAGSQRSGAEIDRLRGFMARWTVHLDRKISEIQRAGTPD
jgi:hypothetical protein